MRGVEDSPLALTAFFCILAGIIGFCSCVRRDSPKAEIWARVNGTPIYQGQVEAVYRRMKAAPRAAKPEQVLSFELRILNNLIDRQVLLQRARQEEIAVSGAEVDSRLQEIRSPTSEQEFDKSLKAQGLTIAAFRDQVRDALLIQRLLEERVYSRVHVTEADIAAYYARNKADFNVPEREYHLAQILVTSAVTRRVDNLMHDDARSERQAERKTRALAAQLRSGEDFAKAASEYSEDPGTAPEGGDMGFVPASSLASDPALDRAVHTLKPGQFSRIIHDGKGFHIVKLLGVIPAGQRALSERKVQNSIRKTLTDEEEELLKAAYIENLRNQARVTDYLAESILSAAGPSIP
ncbi:MAG: peptidylprolyl isomerase [Terriglobia bacterium]